jgi:hypothetical protein
VRPSPLNLQAAGIVRNSGSRLATLPDSIGALVRCSGEAIAPPLSMLASLMHATVRHWRRIK